MKIKNIVLQNLCPWRETSFCPLGWLYGLHEALKLETVIYENLKLESWNDFRLQSGCGNPRVDRHCGTEKGEVSFLKPQTGKMKWCSQ